MGWPPAKRFPGIQGDGNRWECRCAVGPLAVACPGDRTSRSSLLSPLTWAGSTDAQRTVPGREGALEGARRLGRVPEPATKGANPSVDARSKVPTVTPGLRTVACVAIAAQRAPWARGQIAHRKEDGPLLRRGLCPEHVRTVREVHALRLAGPADPTATAFAGEDRRSRGRRPGRTQRDSNPRRIGRDPEGEGTNDTNCGSGERDRRLQACPSTMRTVRDVLGTRGSRWSDTFRRRVSWTTGNGLRAVRRRPARSVRTQGSSSASSSTLPLEPEHQGSVTGSG